MYFIVLHFPSRNLQLLDNLVGTRAILIHTKFSEEIWNYWEKVALWKAYLVGKNTQLFSRVIWNESFRNCTFAESVRKRCTEFRTHLHRTVYRSVVKISLRSRTRNMLTGVLPKHGKTGDRSAIDCEVDRAICCKHWTHRVTHDVQLRLA